MPPPSWEDTLAQLASPHPDQRAAAASMLGATQHPAAVPELARTLTDPAGEVYSAGVTALIRVGHPTVVPRLLAALGDSRSDRRALAASALGALAGRLGTMNLAPLAATRGEPVLLGRTRDPRVMGSLSRILQSPDASSDDRAAAARGLGALGDPRAVPVLRALLEEPTVELRAAAIQGLGQLGDTGCADYFIALLRSQGEASVVRRCAALALGDLRAEEALPTLRDHLLPSAGDLRPAVCVALGRIGGPGALGALRGAAGDRDPVVQRAARTALRQFGGGSGVPHIRPSADALRPEPTVAGPGPQRPPSPSDPTDSDLIGDAASALRKGQISYRDFEELRRQARKDRPPTLSGPPTIEAPKGIGTIGAYTLLQVVGQGGMGTVYRGRHSAGDIARSQGGDVAIKVMNPEFAERTKYRARFEREADVGVRLRHPGIVAALDLVVDGGRLGLVMELVSGDELADLIDGSEGPLSPEAATDLLIPVLAALGNAHDHGVVHRDLKPENILIRDDGVPQLLDFGLARFVDNEAMRRAEAGKFLGTVPYSAPEQLVDSSTAGVPADLYALGLVLFESTTRLLPWDTSVTARELRARRINSPAPPAHVSAPHLPPEFAEVITRATAHAPEDRFQSAEEMAEALRTVPEAD